MKRKSAFFLSMCAIALCLGIMSFGVYSALSANLNLSGYLGFNMHNAIVEVSGSISPVAQKNVSSNNFSPVTKEIKKTAMGGEEETLSNLNLGDLYFYAKEDMVFDFSFKNIGLTPINVTISIDLGSNSDKISIVENIDYITFTDNAYENFILADDTKHVKFALCLNDTSVEIGKNAFNINITFAEVQGVTLTNGYYEGIQYTLDSTTPLETTSSSSPSFLSSSVKPLANKTIYTASVSGCDQDEVTTNYPNAKIQPFITDGSKLYMVTSIGDSAFDGGAGLGSSFNGLKSISIPDSITSIGNYAFRNCENLNKVTMGSNVKDIGSDAFVVSWVSANAKKVFISSLENWCNIDFSNTGSNPVRKDLYLNNILLTKLVLPEHLQAIKPYAFYQCKYLTSIVIPDSVTSIGDYAFYSCTNLKSVTIPNSVEYLGNYVFSACYELTSVTIPEGVTNIGNSAFDYCISLTSIKIPNSVTTIGNNVFQYCYSLTTAIIGNNVRKIGNNMFYYCFDLTSITIGEKVNEIGSDAFYSCHKLVEIIDNSTALSFEVGSGIASKAKEIIIDGSPSKVSIDSNGFVIYNSTVLMGYVGIQKNITIPSGISDINEYAFYQSRKLVSVTIPNNVTFIGQSAFENCHNLTSVTLNSEVSLAYSYIFRFCYNLLEVIDNSTTPATKGTSGKGYLAYYAREVITNGSASKVSIDENGFVIYNGTILAGYTGSQTNIAIPRGITEINKYAFQSSVSLTEVTIPSSVSNIGDYAFAAYSVGLAYLSNLSSVTFEAINPPTFGSLVFNTCRLLSAIYVPTEEAVTAYQAVTNLSTWKNKITKMA